MSARRGGNSDWVSDENISDTKKSERSIKHCQNFWRLVMESESQAGRNSDPCTE